MRSASRRCQGDDRFASDSRGAVSGFVCLSRSLRVRGFASAVSSARDGFAGWTWLDSAVVGHARTGFEVGQV